MPEEKIPQQARGTEYLANERTFLAWIRTSIAIVSLGFVVARFGIWLQEMSGRLARPPVLVHGVSLPMGELMMGLGGLLAILAAWRYHVVNRSIEESRVEPDRGLILLITVAVAVLAVAMAVATLAAARP
jgi:putative membrane protein